MDSRAVMTKRVVLSFDDAVVNHRTFVGPLLKEHGFGATFFICRFSLDGNPNYMSGEQVCELQRMGFEIGNHTVRHKYLKELTEEEARREIDGLSAYLESYGVTGMTSFAYPGGPVVEEVIPILKEKGFTCARSVAPRPWRPAVDEPFAIPAYGVSHDNLDIMKEAVAGLGEGDVAVFCLHGIPDLEHPWVTNTEAFLREALAFLKAAGCQVLSLRDALAQ